MLERVEIEGIRLYCRVIIVEYKHYTEKTQYKSILCYLYIIYIYIFSLCVYVYILYYTLA